MEMNKNWEACLNETAYIAAAARHFKSLAAKINDCFKELHLVGEDGVNSVIKNDIVKIETLAVIKDRHWKKAFASIFSYYEKLFDLMSTLIVADDDEFEKLIFMRYFVNYDISMFAQDIENLHYILKNNLM